MSWQKSRGKALSRKKHGSSNKRAPRIMSAIGIHGRGPWWLLIIVDTVAAGNGETPLDGFDVVGGKNLL